MRRVPDWMRELSSLARSRAEVGVGACLPAPPAEHNQRIAELFETYNAALIRFLTHRLHSAQEAKEVAQEAYVRLLQLDSPDGVSHMQALLFKTAANLAADRVRNTGRRERIHQLRFFGRDAEDAAPSPEETVAAEQEIGEVLSAIEELPPKCRYAFVMHRFYGHELKDVAHLMNISERMVRIYVERAIVHCRKRLASAGGQK